MKLHLVLNVGFPALALLVLASGLGLSSYKYSLLAEKPTEEQLQDVSRKIENNELSAERLKGLAVDTTRSRKALDQSVSEWLRATAVAIVLFTGWLAVGYQFTKKAQQGAPADGPASRARG